MSVLLVECIYGSLNPSVTRIYVLVFLVGLFGVYRAEYTRGQREFSRRGRERLGVGQSGTSSSVNHVVKSRRNRDFLIRRHSLRRNSQNLRNIVSSGILCSVFSL